MLQFLLVVIDSDYSIEVLLSSITNTSSDRIIILAFYPSHKIPNANIFNALQLKKENN